MLEVCIDSLESAIAAEQGGAHRLEVCANLSVGGLTPAYTLLTEIRDRSSIPIMMMVRPRPGDFCYQEAELDGMIKSIQQAKEMDLYGVVFGTLLPTGHLDRVAVSKLMEHCDGLAVTFHRAYDVCTDTNAALDFLLEQGVSRLLTSGKEATAYEGRQHIADLVKAYGSQISIMAGSGLTSDNVLPIVQSTMVREVHGSCKSASSGADTDAKVVSDIVSQLGKL